MKKYDFGKRNFLKLISSLGIIAGIAYVLRKIFGSEEVIIEVAPTGETHTVYADVINERSNAAGVTIDSVLIKDGNVDGADAAAGTGSLRTLGSGSQQATAGNHTH